MDFDLPADDDPRRLEVRAWIAEHPEPTNAQLAEAGYIVPHWPRPWGLDADPMHQLIIDDELRRGGVTRTASTTNAIGVGWAAPTILLAGSDWQKERFLPKIFSGEETWCQLFSEPDSGSDLASLATRAVRDGDEYVINGHKWYTTNSTHPRCEIMIFMGKSDPDNPDRHRQQSMILVPRDTPGVEVLRPLPVFNFYGMPDRASEVRFTDVRVPASNTLLGEGRGFEIAQGRLGPGRIHHCMRLVGLAERALELMCRRTQHRVAFGRPVSEQSVTLERIAESRIAIEQTRLLTLRTAHLMDTVGNKEARREIAMIKIAAPNMACKVVDWAIQAFGGAGTNNDYGLSAMYATARLLRLADGPDEVHRNQLGRLELKRHADKGPVEARVYVPDWA